MNLDNFSVMDMMKLVSQFESKDNIFSNDSCLDFTTIDSPLCEGDKTESPKYNTKLHLFHLKGKKIAKKKIITKKCNKTTSLVSFKFKNNQLENDFTMPNKHKTTVSKLTFKAEEFDKLLVKKEICPYNIFNPEFYAHEKSADKLPWTLASLSLCMSNNRAALRFCQKRKLLPTSKQCPVCHEQMLFSEKLSSDKGLGYVFRCSRRACQIVRSARSGTWFEKSKLPIRKSLLLTYCFSANFPFNLAVHESSFTAGCTSPSTVSDWYSYCREVCTHAMSCQMSIKLGGECCVVEVDEIVIGGKFTRKKAIEGQVILGFYCRLTGRVSIACIPQNKRDGNILVSIIENYVNTGSNIHLSCWNPEEVLGPGYQHLCNNCHIQFEVLEHGNNNMGIQKVWRLLKAYIPHISSRKKSDQLYAHLCEFLWRRWVDVNKLDPFEAFLNAAAILYTLPSDELSC